MACHKPRPKPSSTKPTNTTSTLSTPTGTGPPMPNQHSIPPHDFHHSTSTTRASTASPQKSPDLHRYHRETNSVANSALAIFFGHTSSEDSSPVLASLRPSLIYGRLTSVLSPCSGPHHLAEPPPSNTRKITKPLIFRSGDMSTHLPGRVCRE